MRFLFRATGPYALWCPAWLRTDPLSEPVPTPSGLGGMLRSFFRKPEWAWEIDSYAVLSPIRYETLARSAHKAEVSEAGDFQRMPQRRTVLVDVDYLICARVFVYEKALDPARGRSARDVELLVDKRLSGGVPTGVTYGGQSEFVLKVEYLGVTEKEGPDAVRSQCLALGTPPIPETQELGPLLVDLIHDGGQVFVDEAVQAIYRRLRMDLGVVSVPESAYEEKRKLDEEAQVAYRAKYGHKPQHRRTRAFV